MLYHPDSDRAVEFVRPDELTPAMRRKPIPFGLGRNARMFNPYGRPSLGLCSHGLTGSRNFGKDK